jgi:hypothetical protein
MRPFIAAGLVVIVMAVGAGIILDRFVQESASVAFATSAVRI